jgi:hypothetical protein
MAASEHNRPNTKALAGSVTIAIGQQSDGKLCACGRDALSDKSDDVMTRTICVRHGDDERSLVARAVWRDAPRYPFCTAQAGAGRP